MAIPTGSVGISWISGSQNSTPVSLGLPVTFSYVYQAPRSASIISASSGLPAPPLVYYRTLTVQSYTSASTVLSGTIDRLVIYQTSNITFGLVDVQFVQFDPAILTVTFSNVIKYAFTEAPSARKGLFLQKSSGSPQLTLEPSFPSASWLLSGDMWMLSGSRHPFHYADYADTTLFTTSSIVPYTILASHRPDIFDGGNF